MQPQTLIGFAHVLGPAVLTARAVLGLARARSPRCASACTVLVLARAWIRIIPQTLGPFKGLLHAGS